ncbi:hypothetical protein Tco_0877965 [Tanacetum coccineum]|uniref:Retrovirus-related Pol polyprotein from transposon TNT 1-94-like beta-barrel domain-containing protein n=1 Tax=Tanacetum coccineum TaxID=301880 RepID=A0ABQ5C1X2_9ASTR
MLLRCSSEQLMTRSLKGKNIVESVQNVHNLNVVTSKVYKLDLPPLFPCIKNNMAAHVDYVKHTQTNANILREIVEDAKELRPLDLDGNLASACKFVTRIQELLVYVSATCPSTKHVSDNGSKPRSNTKKDRIIQTSSSNKKTNKVKDQPRIAKSSLNNTNRVSKTVYNANVMHFVLNANFELICATCHECMFDTINDLCVSDYLNDVHARVNSKSVKSKSAKSIKKKMWKPTSKVYTNVGYSWKPTGHTFTIDGNTCPLTRIISAKVVHLRNYISTTPVKQTQPSSNKYGELKDITNVWSSSKSKTISSKISNHSEPMQNWESNVSTAPSSSRGTVRFGNDQIAKIMGYGDYQLGNVTISRVYYVEGLGHNLFSVGQFCDSDLEVAFRKHTCYVQNLDGADLLSGSRDANLYTISLDDMLNTLNQLAKQGLVRGQPKLKFEKDHLCSTCSLGKSKKYSHKPKADDTNQEKL